jgi:hypothetical protein
LQDLEEGGYQASATQLSVLSSPKPDPTAFAPDVTAFVKTKVASVGRGPQSMLLMRAVQGLDPKTKEFVNACLA